MLPTLIIQQKIHIIRGKYDSLRSQFATLKSERGQHSKYMTYVNTPIKQFFTFLFLLSYTVGYAQQDSVTIHGQVTDFTGKPQDSTTIIWQYANFRIAAQASTDKDGYYTARIPKGKYQSMAAVNFGRYLHTASADVADTDKRLEFWGWDFIADRDTTLNLRYHRMEAYGIRVFRIPGSMPTYQIFVQPQGLTRIQHTLKEHPDLLTAGKNLKDIQQEPLNEKATYVPFGPSIDQLKATVWIDGEEVTLLHKQCMELYLTSNYYTNAYLLTVDRPKHDTTLPYHLFKVELEDLENGDRGEGIYYMEKETYIKQ